MTIKERERYKEYSTKQKRGTIPAFNNFFLNEKFKAIAEIGTGSGGFSLYIAKKCKEMGATFFTFDIKAPRKKVIKELMSLGGKFVYGDINKNLDIINIIRKPTRFLLLNDGGLKVPQFIRFSSVIKEGDIMITHDYYKNWISSAAGAVIPKDVNKYIEENNLRIIYEDLFDSLLWLCCIKEPKS